MMMIVISFMLVFLICVWYADDRFCGFIRFCVG